MRMVRAMLCRSFTFIGHIAHLKKTVKDGKDSKNPNFFRKYRNRNSPIHIFVFFEKVLKTTVFTVFTVCNPPHSTFWGLCAFCTICLFSPENLHFSFYPHPFVSQKAFNRTPREVSDLGLFAETPPHFPKAPKAPKANF